MLVFLDTEFTSFERPELLSLALVAEDGREFYAELADYPESQCSEFVHETVLPLFGRVPQAACDSAKLALRLRSWFETLPEPAIIVFDFQTDWHLLAGAMPGRPLDNLAEPLCLDRHTISHPIFERAKSLIYTQDWPPHHALADARALMAGYRAWRRFREKFGRIG